MGLILFCAQILYMSSGEMFQLKRYSHDSFGIQCSSNCSAHDRYQFLYCRIILHLRNICSLARIWLLSMLISSRWTVVTYLNPTWPKPKVRHVIYDETPLFPLRGKETGNLTLLWCSIHINYSHWKCGMEVSFVESLSCMSEMQQTAFISFSYICNPTNG